MFVYSGQPGLSLGFLLGKNIQGSVNWLQGSGVCCVPPAGTVTSQDRVLKPDRMGKIPVLARFAQEQSYHRMRQERK